MKIEALSAVIGASVEQTKAALNAISNLTGTAAGGALIGGGLKGLKTSKTTQTVNTPRYDTSTGQVINQQTTTSWEH